MGYVSTPAPPGQIGSCPAPCRARGHQHTSHAPAPLFGGGGHGFHACGCSRSIPHHPGRPTVAT
eukprot:12920523-Prorocentrum_lima.AAC.1